MSNAPLLHWDFERARALPHDGERAIEEGERLRAKIDELRRSGTAGFFDLPARTDLLSAALSAAAHRKPIGGDLIIIGIGGSSLGARALNAALGELPGSGHTRLTVIDNVDPGTLHALLERQNWANATVNVVTKSGSTPETMAAFAAVLPRLQALCGDDWTSRIVATTTGGRGPLAEFAVANKIETLSIPENVGGRFSVLTAVGLFPAAVLGIDAMGLLRGAMTARAQLDGPVAEDTALRYAQTLIGHTTSGKNIAVTMPYADRLAAVADWFAQLWAESLGKRTRTGLHVGQTPVRALGATDQHSQVQLYMEGPRDKVVTFLRVDKPANDPPIPTTFADVSSLAWLGGHTFGELLDAEWRGTRDALSEANVPSVTVSLPSLSASAIGELLFTLEAATVYAGLMLGIDPFDQPGVEAGKLRAKQSLGGA
jgi:glucose-6-phosphate isomerase